MKQLCEKAVEILVEEANVQRVDAPVTICEWGGRPFPAKAGGPLSWARGARAASKLQSGVLPAFGRAVAYLQPLLQRALVFQCQQPLNAAAGR